jgi:O-antigen ligase
LQARLLAKRKARRNERLLSLVFLAMIWWLLSMSHSATSLICALVGIAMMLVLGTDRISKKHLGSYIIAGALLFGLAETTVGVYGNALKMLGRDPTLTDRTEVWADALAIVTDPVFGSGFESFWLGERLEKLWQKWWWQPTQAHNGYIEIYLNLGMVGVVLLLALAVAMFKKIQRMLLRDFEMGRLRMGFFVAILLYNFTEAAFKGVSLVWLVWHIIALDYPHWNGAADVNAADAGLEPETGGPAPHGSWA